MPNLQELQEAAEAAQLAVEEAGKAADAAVMEYVAARTNTFDAELVSKARDLGVNPDNFDSEEQLQIAVKTREDEENANADQKN